MNIKSLQLRRAFCSVLFVLLLSAAGMTKGLAYDFSAVSSTGQRLYYTVTNSTNHYVKVVYPGGSSSSPWNGFNKPTGDMEIPQTVSNDGINYQVTAIEQYAFYECTDLTGAVIPNTVTTINDYAFYGCTNLSELTIGTGVQYIYNYAFWNCPGLATVHFNATNCSQMYTRTGSSSNYQYWSPFNSGTTNGGASAIATLTIGENVTQVPNYAFRNAGSLCNGVVIPNSVTYIGSYAFNGCTCFANLHIPNAVTSIGDYAFTNVNEIRSAAVTPPTISSNTFSGVSLNVPLYVPCESRYSYQTANYWRNFTNYQTRPPYELFVEANNPNYGEVSIEKYGDCDDLECIVQAYPLANFSFMNWTKDDIVVSTDMRYTFDFEEETTLVAHFAQLTNHWTPVSGLPYEMFIFGIVSIDSIEQSASALELGAFCGEECRGAVLPFEEDGQWWYLMEMSGYAGDVLDFKLYDHVTEQELDLVCVNTVLFEINGVIDPYEFMFVTPVAVTAETNPAGAGTISGTGSYPLGTIVTLTVTPNSGFVFLNWTVDGELVGTETSYTFTVSGPVNVVANFNYQQTIQLVAGWNWFSTNVEITLDDLKAALVAALPGTFITIKSKNTSTTYIGNKWRGTLNALDLSQMYMIKTTAAREITLTGTPINPEEYPATISYGVNWIAFPFNENMSVANAFAGFATNGDMIKSKNLSSSYTNRWRGTLSTLNPGLGYIYKSNVEDDRTLIFPVNMK